MHVPLKPYLLWYNTILSYTWCRWISQMLHFPLTLSPSYSLLDSFSLPLRSQSGGNGTVTSISWNMPGVPSWWISSLGIETSCSFRIQSLLLCWIIIHWMEWIRLHGGELKWHSLLCFSCLHSWLWNMSSTSSVDFDEMEVCLQYWYWYTLFCVPCPPPPLFFQPYSWSFWFWFCFEIIVLFFIIFFKLHLCWSIWWGIVTSIMYWRVVTKQFLSQREFVIHLHYNYDCCYSVNVIS